MGIEKHCTCKTLYVLHKHLPAHHCIRSYFKKSILLRKYLGESISWNWGNQRRLLGSIAFELMILWAKFQCSRLEHWIQGVSQQPTSGREVQIINIKEKRCAEIGNLSQILGYSKRSHHWGTQLAFFSPTSQQADVPERELDPMKRGGKTIRYQAQISPTVISSCAGHLDRDPRMVTGAKGQVSLLGTCRSPVASSRGGSLVGCRTALISVSHPHTLWYIK